MNSLNFEFLQYPINKDVDEQNYHILFPPLLSGSGYESTISTGMRFHNPPVSFDPQSTMKEKQTYFNVRIAEQKSSRLDVGLGDPPCIRSVADLLVFDSFKNPYRKGITFEDIEIHRKTRAKPVPTGRKLAEAPPSLEQQSYEIQQPGFSYTPGPPSDVPLFDIPDQLPDLPGMRNSRTINIINFLVFFF